MQQQRGLTDADLWRYLVVWRRQLDGSEVGTCNKQHLTEDVRFATAQSLC